MPSAPKPITSPPPVPGQPYNASAPAGVPDDQSASQTVYNPAGGAHAADPWPKIQEGGAASMTTGEPTGRWPGDGSSSSGGWKQV
jgi:hypothetical protein